MGKKSSAKRNELLNGVSRGRWRYIQAADQHPAYKKHRAHRAWAKLHAQRHHGVFVERQLARQGTLIDGVPTMGIRSVPAIHGLKEYNKLTQKLGFGVPSLHYAHRLQWHHGRVVGFNQRKKDSPERRKLNRTLPRGKAVQRLMKLEKANG